VETGGNRWKQEILGINTGGNRWKQGLTGGNIIISREWT
jgi:hypothetical protein